MVTPTHVLVLPDMQVPYHDGGVIQAVLDYAKDQKIDECIILGDFMDLDCLSTYNRGKPKLLETGQLHKDYNQGNCVLDAIQEACRHNNADCQFTYLEGNHEYRVQRFAEESNFLDGLLDVQKHLELDRRGIRWIPCYSVGDVYQIGRAHFHHGLYVNKNHAKSMVEAFGVNVFYGHVHDVMCYSQRRWGEDSTIVGQSLGCLCRYDLSYVKKTPTNWQQAFADFWFWPDGHFQYHVTSIFDGRFFGPNGKAYQRPTLLRSHI